MKNIYILVIMNLYFGQTGRKCKFPAYAGAFVADDQRVPEIGKV